MISMQGKDDCHDNAIIGTAFSTNSAELIWRTVSKTRSCAEQELGANIAFDTPRQRHYALT
jgi:hypothetical protein